MRQYLARRIVQLVPLLVGISALSFAIIHFAPGDPAALLIDRELATPERYRELKVELGLDDPLPVQYVKTMVALAKGDLVSYKTRVPVIDLVKERLPTTLTLGILAILFGVLVGATIGILQALRPNSLFDYVGTVVALFGFTVPSFWLGLMLIMLFAVRLHWLPVSGIRPPLATGWDPREMAPYLVMPTVVLSTGLMGTIARYVRSSMLESLGQDYVRTAHAKGLPRRTVVVRHALRNSLLPVITLLGFTLPFLISGAAIVESIFSLPGVGRLALDSVFIRDYPVVITVTIFSAIAAVLGNLLADVLYGVADPRIQYG